MKQVSLRVLMLVCLAACHQLQAKRQRFVLTNNSNNRVFACTSMTTCKPLSRPALDPGDHRNLYLPLINESSHRFNLFLSSNYLDAQYQVEHQQNTKRVVLLREGFEIDSIKFSTPLGSRAIALVIAPDLSLTFDKSWSDITLEKMPEFPGRTVHLPARRNCTKEPFARSNQRALAKREIADDDDLPFESSVEA